MSSALRQVAADRLQIREGGGCLSVFGLPFFGAGISMILASLGVIPLSNGSEVPDAAWLVLLLMGAVFTAVGGALVFGRSWTTIDSTRRVLSKEWGLLLPMRARTHQLDDDTAAVVLGFAEGDSDSADRFPIGLQSRSGRILPLFSATTYAEARARAAAVATHLHLDIEDGTTDHPARVPAAQADLPMRQRLRLTDLDAERVERPAGARSEVVEEHGRVRIVIPVARLHPALLALMLVPPAVPLFLVAPFAEFFRRTHTPPPVGWFFLGFLIVVFGVLPAISALNAFLRSRVGRTIVVVSSEGIQIRERGAWMTKTVASLAASDILDVDISTKESTLGAAREAAQRAGQPAGTSPGAPVLGPRTGRLIRALSRLTTGRGITVKTRSGLTTFGRGLDDEEIRYLHAAVRRGLLHG